MLPTRYWAEMTWRDFLAPGIEETIAVLPVAAVEQHGPHLPLGVDLLLMQGYIERVVERLPDDLPVLFLPIQAVGVSTEHESFRGTLSLSAASLIAVLGEIGASVARAGIRKLVLLNSHGGNVALLDVIAQQLRAKHRLLAVKATWHRFGYPDELFAEDELKHGIHAGDVETSLMLSFRPDLVREDERQDFSSASRAIEGDFTWLRTGRPTGFGWMSQDLSAAGAMGNAAAATVEKGDAAADYGVTAFIELLQDVEAFDLARLRNGPEKD
jgi:creatinine amidohydrolase